MDDDDFPDMPLDNFGADTNVAAPQAEEPKTAQEADANGSEEAKAGQPDATEDNPKAESQSSEQATAGDKAPKSGEDKPQSADPAPDANASGQEEQPTGRPDKQSRTQARFDELTGKLYKKDEIIQQLESEVAQSRAMKGIEPLQPDENGYIDPKALHEQQIKIARAQAEAVNTQVANRLEREQIAQRLDREGNEIESRFKSYLDDDPIHAENIKALVEERVNDNLYNTNGLKSISPLKIAERYFKGIESASKKAQVKTQQNLDDLKADSAVNPTDKGPQKDPNSIEALEERLADVNI